MNFKNTLQLFVLLSFSMIILMPSCSEDTVIEYPRKYNYAQNKLGTASFYTIENDQVKEIGSEGILLEAHNSLLDAEKNVTPLFFIERIELVDESTLVMKEFEFIADADSAITVNYTLEDNKIILYEDTLELERAFIFYDEESDRVYLPFLAEYIRKKSGSGGVSYDTDIQNPENVLSNGLGTRYENGDSIYFNRVDIIYERVE